MSDVRIYHPDRDRSLLVPAHLYPGRLAAKGWQLAEPPAPAPEPAAETPAPVEEPSEKEQLQAVLRARGVDFDGRAGVKTLRKLLADSEATE